MTTDTSEKGLEALIVAAMTGDGSQPLPASGTRETGIAYGGDRLDRRRPERL